MTTRRMRAIIATLAAACAAAAVAPSAQADGGTLSNGICWTAQRQAGSFAGQDGSWRISLRCRPRVLGDYVATKYNVRFQFATVQHLQFERSDGQGANWFYADQADDVFVQGCRKRWLKSYCGPWARIPVPY